LDGLPEIVGHGRGVESETAEAQEPDGCTRPVFRIASTLDTKRIAAISAYPRAVLVFGPHAVAADVTASLDALARHAPSTITANIVFTEDVAAFEELLANDRLFYVCRGELSARDLDALIDGALLTKHADATPDHFLRADHLRRIALAQSVAELAEALRASVAGAVEAGHARCVLFDAERQVLWTPNESDGDSPAVGLVSFIHRTGAVVCLPRAGGDPRFDAALDDPHGAPTDRFLGVPIRANGAVMAVLVAVRPAQQPAFEPREIAAMEAVAAHASPYVAAWLAEAGEAESVFRRRALRELEHPIAAGPEPLRLEPAWMQRASWVAIAMFVAVVIALLFAWKGVAP
jgi:GAF domain-containing protein